MVNFLEDKDISFPESEQKYLENILSNIYYELDIFVMPFGDGKEVIGVMSGDDEKSNNLNEFFKYKTLYNSLIDLDIKIKFSLQQAIISSQQNKMLEAYYYIENGVFRIITAWDNLAQVYNIYSGLNKGIDEVYYACIFEQKKGLAITDTKFMKFRENVEEYIKEEDNINITSRKGYWMGNNKYIRKLRNQMSHRNSIAKVSLSDYDMHIPDVPIFILKRLVEDYETLNYYYGQMLELIKDYFS